MTDSAQFLGVARDLAGKRIVITRPEAQAQQFIELLHQIGAVPILFPTIEIDPIAHNDLLVTALQHLSDYDWVVFTSVNGAKIVLDQLPAHPSVGLEKLNSRHIAVIGPATAAALNERGIHVDLQPDEFIAEALFGALASHGPLAGQRFLLLRADTARPALREHLTAEGALVDEVPVYRTRRGQPAPAAFAELRAGVDVITFSSSSTVRYFFELLGNEALVIAGQALIACLGPITAKTAQEHGLQVKLVADEYTIPGLVAALTGKTTL